MQFKIFLKITLPWRKFVKQDFLSYLFLQHIVMYLQKMIFHIKYLYLASRNIGINM